MRPDGRLEPDPLLCHRVLAAWLRLGQANAGPAPGGLHPIAYLCQHEGSRYAVVISAGGGVLAVYGIHPDGALVRLGHWPKEIEGY
jgi:hypothetical protein